MLTKTASPETETTTPTPRRAYPFTVELEACLPGDSSDQCYPEPDPGDPPTPASPPPSAQTSSSSQ